jgi:heptosyltransferase-3
MNFKNLVNRYRRRIMHSMTAFVGNAESLDLKNESIHRVIIVRPNSRLGNQLLITPLVQEVCDVFPMCEIDLFVRGGAASAIFSNYHQVRNIIKLPSRPFKHLLNYLFVWLKLKGRRYDLAINAEGGSSSGRLATRLSRAKYKIYDLSDSAMPTLCSDYRHIAKKSIYNMRHLLSKNEEDVLGGPVPTLSIKLSENEVASGKMILGKYVDTRKKTIFIYTFATGDKCYSPLWWQSFYSLLKVYCGSKFNIVEMLPKENVSQINFAAPSIYSLDVREMASIIANGVAFITADCGIMHLAVASGTATIGLFKVTDMERYAPYGGYNMAIDTNNKSAEDIFSEIRDKFLLEQCS